VTFLTAGGHIAHMHGSTAIIVESIAHTGLQAFPVAGEKKIIHYSAKSRSSLINFAHKHKFDRARRSLDYTQ